MLANACELVNLARRDSCQKVTFWAGSGGHGSSLGPFFIKSNINENGYQNDILPQLKYLRIKLI